MLCKIAFIYQHGLSVYPLTQCKKSVVHSHDLVQQTKFLGFLSLAKEPRNKALFLEAEH